MVNRPTILLSISGGGYCGLYAAQVLELIEQDLGGKRLIDCVDMVAGTSIGGVIALALAKGLSAQEIREKIETDGPAIFGYHNNKIKKAFSRTFSRGKSIILPRYSAKELKKLTNNVLGDTTMESALLPVVVTAVNATNSEPKLFRNYGPSHDQHMKMIDAALATSAAPTYFPAHWIEPNSYIDGGLIANNPYLIITNHAQAYFKVAPSDIVLLSIGAIDPTTSSGSVKKRFAGALPTLLGLRTSISFTLEVQQKLASLAAKDLLGDNYLRITRIPAKEEEAFTRLDRADDKATRTLESLARQSYAEHKSKQILEHFRNGTLPKRIPWENGELVTSHI